MRGGTFFGVGKCLQAQGLSPHARGNLGLAGRSALDRGPIPACAGEPPGRAVAVVVGWAYPRMRGGTKVIEAAT